MHDPELSFIKRNSFGWFLAGVGTAFVISILFRMV